MENIIEKLNRIDQILADRDTAQTGFVHEVLHAGGADRVYLLNVASSRFSKEMFIYLEQLGAFDFETIPGPKIEKNSEGDENRWFYGWDAGFLLRAAALANMEQPDEAITSILLKIIDQYIDYVYARTEDLNRNYRPDWFFCDCIEFLPLDKITNKHWKFIREIGMSGAMSHVGGDIATTFFKRVVEAKHTNLILEILDLLYSPAANPEKGFFEIRPLVDAFIIQNFADNHAADIMVTLGPQALDWLIQRTALLSKQFPQAFNKLLIVSIAEDSQNWHNDGLSQLVVRQLRNCMDVEGVSDDILKNYAEKLLKSEIPVLQRVAIYTINRHFGLLQELFWKLINPLDEFEWELEVFKLLETHIEELDEHRMEIVVTWMEQLKFHELEGYSPDQLEKIHLSHKVTWYKVFSDTMLIRPNFPLKDRILNAREELKAGGGVESSHPGYSSYFTTRTGGDVSLQRLTGQDIGTVISRIQTPDQWQGYDQWGIQEDTRRLVIERPVEVMEQIALFTEIPSQFLYYVYDGFQNLLSSRTEIAWEQLLNFTLSLLEKRADLWAHDGKIGGDNSTLIGMIAWLIRDGVQKDQFNDQALAVATRILVTADGSYTRPFEYLNQNKDQNFDIINSTRGKIYEAMIVLSLQLAKTKEEAERWEPSIKAVFDRRLKDKSFLDEFYWMAGHYTPQLTYLDKAWWMENRSLIYIVNEDIEDFAFKGYLLYAARVYSDIYEALLEYYYRALATYQQKNVYSDRLVEHIAIAAVFDLPSGVQLFEEMMKSRQIHLIGHLVQYIDRKDIVVSQDKLQWLWRSILDTLELIGGREASAVMFATTDFIDTLELIDDTIVGLFTRAVAHYSVDPRVHRLAESLTGFIPKDPVRAGLMLQLLLDKTYGDISYGSNKIIDGLRALYEKGQGDTADRIALHLAEEGNFYVKDIYNRFHPAVKS